MCLICRYMYLGVSMVLISYDISNDKLRTKFSKFLERFGHRIQYSIFEIENSKTMLNNICLEIEGNFEAKFSQSDSVMIFNLSNNCKVTRYGYAKNEEKELFIL